MGFANSRNENRREGGKRGQTVREGHPGNLSGNPRTWKRRRGGWVPGAIGETIVEIAQQTNSLLLGKTMMEQMRGVPTSMAQLPMARKNNKHEKGAESQNK